MKVAIVTGTSGLIGGRVCEKFLSEGYRVLAIGRAREAPLEHHEYYYYCYVPGSESNDSVLCDMKSVTDKCLSPVFINFAWGGAASLTDGSIEQQLKNVSHSASFVKLAKTLGCEKFINCGSQEEALLEAYLQGQWQSEAYNPQKLPYALAKLAARDTCRLVAYLEGIDYVHTRLSIVVDPASIDDKFINNSVKAILSGGTVETPITDKRLFDFTYISDVVEGYFQISKLGKNKSDYFVGSGSLLTIDEFFGLLQTKVANGDINAARTPATKARNLWSKSRMFDPYELFEHTQFRPRAVLDYIEEILA